MTAETIEQVLAEFRSWLQDPASGAASAPREEPLEPPPDLHTLLGQFIALRHEVNLQTRAARAQQEQNAETLLQLSEAVQTVQAMRASAAEREQPVQDQLLRPLLKTLVDLADALGLAKRELQRAQPAVSDTLEQLADLPLASGTASAPRAQPQGGFWSRVFGQAPALNAVQDVPVNHRDDVQEQVQLLADRIDRQLESLVTGYNMSLARIQRALQQHGLEPMACEGQPFDPERMEVVEVVEGSGRPGGQVVEEMRPGYLWNGRVFRYAQVRVAKL